ncbi:hypothetical protein BZA05DRAFT_264490 [Tricharina praecox]|uniref:uncharacterized protein n=1 Tax=Tricharina praecox TaxID=43433 RepID=UPI00221F76CA|nr:uncharacterized protein BZA05DRAFT_264490 [Tricharina praecox]KAI5854399.1 hypothetical protein BZA05DRAFT_264490 [Tricharina praecox]
MVMCCQAGRSDRPGQQQRLEHQRGQTSPKGKTKSLTTDFLRKPPKKISGNPEAPPPPSSWTACGSIELALATCDCEGTSSGQSPPRGVFAYCGISTPSFSGSIPLEHNPSWRPLRVHPTTRRSPRPHRSAGPAGHSRFSLQFVTALLDSITAVPDAQDFMITPWCGCSCFSFFYINFFFLLAPSF